MENVSVYWAMHWKKCTVYLECIWLTACQCPPWLFGGRWAHFHIVGRSKVRSNDKYRQMLTNGFDPRRFAKFNLQQSDSILAGQRASTLTRIRKRIVVSTIPRITGCDEWVCGTSYCLITETMTTSLSLCLLSHSCFHWNSQNELICNVVAETDCVFELYLIGDVSVSAVFIWWSMISGFCEIMRSLSLSL